LRTPASGARRSLARPSHVRSLPFTFTAYLDRPVRLAQGGPPGVKGGAGVGLWGMWRESGREQKARGESGRAARENLVFSTPRGVRLTPRTASAPTLTLAASTAAWWWSRVSRAAQGTAETAWGVEEVEAATAAAAARRAAASRAVGQRMAIMCALGAVVVLVAVVRGVRGPPAERKSERGMYMCVSGYYLFLFFFILHFVGGSDTSSPPREERSLLPHVRA